MAPTSLTVDVQYSMAETLRRAVMNTIMGIATVFVVLDFPDFPYLPVPIHSGIGAKKKLRKRSCSGTGTCSGGSTCRQRLPADDTELIAVIAAAIAAAEGTSTDRFVVRSIRKINRKKISDRRILK